MPSIVTSIDPFVLLNEVFEIDQLAAVRIANVWGDASGTTEQYKAACTIVERQTVLSMCVDCHWPVVEDSPHHYCIGRLLAGDPDDVDDDEDDDDRWGQCLRCQRNLTESEAALNNVCVGCRPAYFEEWQNEQDRLAEEADERRRYPEESDDDDGCPHCGSHACNTWDCQQ